MRFVMTATGMAPTDGALIPFLMDSEAKEMAKEQIREQVREHVYEAATDFVLQALADFGIWLQTKGLLLIAEGFLLWAMICILLAIAGKGPWMERGLKSFLASTFIFIAQKGMV